MANKTTFARWIAGIALLSCSLWGAVALAAVPASLTQQGRILDSKGAPVSSKVAIVFTVYDDPTKSATKNLLWTETQNITLDDGYFSAQLGADAANAFPAAAFDGTVRYLGVTVGSDAEMTPRQAITSVPYAFHAGSADTATHAATADAAPFTGLTGIPAACPAGQYLKGYTAGAAVCVALPALSCTTRFASLAGTTNESVTCTGAGEVLTGGGCYTSGVAMTASYPFQACATQFCLACFASPCAANSWSCSTAATTTVEAYARCCTVQ